MKKRIFSLLLVFIFPSLSPAAVNVKTASFLEEVTDRDSPDPLFQIKRRYNSRSLHMGYVGFGWCSSLERRLEIAPNRRTVRLQSCWTHQDDVFTHEESSQDGDGFFTRSGTNEAIFLRGNSYYFSWRDESGGLVDDSFDSLGRWVGRKTQSGWIRLEYGEGRLPIRLLGTDEIVTLTTARNGRWIRKISAAGKESLFTYDGLDLVRVEAGSNPINYTYDSFHNLTEIRERRGRQVSITYDLQEDRVRTVLNGLFVERYSYRARGRDFQVSVLVETPNSLPLVSRYIFNRVGLEDLRLAKVEMERGWAQFEVVYGPSGQWKQAHLRDAIHEWRLRLDRSGAVVAQQGPVTLAPQRVLAQLHFEPGVEP